MIVYNSLPVFVNNACTESISKRRSVCMRSIKRTANESVKMLCWVSACKYICRDRDMPF